MSVAGHEMAPAVALSGLSLAHRNVIAMAGISVFAVVYQLRWGTIPDTSWLITVCERMLSGERLYADIYETNPPFTVWLYLPPVALARALDIAPEIAVHAWTYVLALTGLLFAGAIVHRARFPEAPALFVLAPAFYAMLVVFPGIAFSEREHIGAALFLPLLALLAWRARSDAPVTPGAGLALFAGLSGSVLLLVKPYYAVMVVAPTLFILWRKRSLWSIFALEYWVIGLVCSGYLAAVLVIHPGFVRDIYPVLADTYLKIATYLPIVAQFGLTWLFLMFLAWRLWPKGPAPELPTVAILASVAGMGPLFYQAKGWAYHAYPALLLAVLALLCLWALPPERRRFAAGSGRLPLLMKPTWAVVLTGVIASYAPFWITQKPNAELVSAVRRVTDNPSIALIGSDMAKGHPLNRMVEGRWASTHVSDWLGTFALYLSMRAEQAGDQAEAVRYDAIVNRYATEKRREFERSWPDLILFQQDEPFWTGLLIRRFGFDAILSRYRVLAEDDEVRIYLKSDYAPFEPVAAHPSPPGSGEVH